MVPLFWVSGRVLGGKDSSGQLTTAVIKKDSFISFVLAISHQ